MAKTYTGSKWGLHGVYFHKSRPYHNEIWHNSNYGRRIRNKHVWGSQSFIPMSTTRPLPHQPPVSSSRKNGHGETTVWRNDWIQVSLSYKNIAMTKQPCDEVRLYPTPLPSDRYPVISSHGHFVTAIFVWQTGRRLMEKRASPNMFISNASPIITVSNFVVIWPEFMKLSPPEALI